MEILGSSSSIRSRAKRNLLALDIDYLPIWPSGRQIRIAMMYLCCRNIDQIVA